MTADRSFVSSPPRPGATATPPAADPKAPRSAATGRRRTLAALAAGALGSMLPVLAGAQQRPPPAPTPADAEGPFYPRSLPADRDADLTRVTGRAGVAQGTLLYLSGAVRRADGTPLAGTTVELWQCDALGVYHHVGAAEAQDENFQGYGVVVVAADGRYAFKTIRPVPYPGRPPHLHLKLTPKTGAALTTQLYVRGDGGPTSVFVGRDRDRLSLSLAPATGREPGALAAEFDFVLR